MTRMDGKGFNPAGNESREQAREEVCHSTGWGGGGGLSAVRQGAQLRGHIETAGSPVGQWGCSELQPDHHGFSSGMAVSDSSAGGAACFSHFR